MPGSTRRSMRTAIQTTWDYEVGDRLRVKDREWCQYSNLVGELVEITRFKDSGILQFTDEECLKARRPDRVLNGGRKVHFYFRELDPVHTTMVLDIKCKI